ncbi:uncharacterized protein LOC130775591 [Actinidia eriantha]|uniref:uncharacterized protein LOC130775591 n=1 Tax=Actinidia eriantha TaxID=165200 RepID=UPI002585AA84|nr:uncharacterized protein LOC130775591 [Actinidia eriantha]
MDFKWQAKCQNCLRILQTEESKTYMAKDGLAKLPISQTFIYAMAGLKEKLLTKDKLQGVIEDISCPLCKAEVESIDHLFFYCRIANEIWAKVKSWLGITRGIQTLKAAVKWMIKEARGTGVPAKIKRINLASTVYHIWEARNQRNFEGKIKHPEAIIRRIQIQVYRCLYGLFPDIASFT